MQRIPEKPIKRFRSISSSKSLEVSGVQISKECIWAIHLLEWPKPETLITPMLARSNRNSIIAGGNAKWCLHFGRQFGSF
jgi:hypothetical protein